MNPTHPHSRHRSAGFTLVEIMVVIVILGLLAGIVVPNLISQTEEARVETTRTNLRAANDTVKMFVVKRSKIPEWEDLTSPGENGQAPLLEGGTPKDAWNNELIIRALEGRLRFELISKGPDGIEDTDDDIVFPERQNQ
ncbi:MAG: type II secretion system protein GspG [Planctomycetota bacterium]